MYRTKDISIYFSTTVTAALRGLRPRPHVLSLLTPIPLTTMVFILIQKPILRNQSDYCKHCPYDATLSCQTLAVYTDCLYNKYTIN